LQTVVAPGLLETAAATTRRWAKAKPYVPFWLQG
jgi:hypothetical protein